MKKNIPHATLLISVIFMDLLAGMEFDLFVPSFPALQHHFGLTPFWVEALLSVNFLGYCLSLFFVGGLADRYGRKPVIMWGLVIFTMGSLLCLGLQSYPFFLLGRGLQGVGVAAPAVLGFLIIADAYPIKQQQFLIAILNGIMNMSVAISPVIGSYITLYFQWQGNFMALLLLGILTLVMSWFFIPGHKAIPPTHNNDVPGGYRAIFQSKSLLLLIIALPILFVPYWIFVGMSPLLYMNDLGVSLAHFGYYQGAFALVFALGCLVFALMLKHYVYDQKKLLRISGHFFIVSITAMVLLALLKSTHPLLITLSFMPFVIGQIIPNTILYPLSLNILPHLKGRVSAIIQVVRLILTALGLQLAAYFYRGSFQSLGIVLAGFVLMAAIMLGSVIKNRELMMWG